MEKSSIKSSIEQAHEQNNKLVKIDCSATDLLNDDDEDMEIPHHHEETDAFEKQFCEDVKLLCDAMRELGNPFTDTEGELLHIISKTIMAKESVDSVKKVLSIGENQYNDYVSARIIKCKVLIFLKKE